MAGSSIRTPNLHLTDVNGIVKPFRIPAALPVSLKLDHLTSEWRVAGHMYHLRQSVQGGHVGGVGETVTQLTVHVHHASCHAFRVVCQKTLSVTTQLWQTCIEYL